MKPSAQPADIGSGEAPRRFRSSARAAVFTAADAAAAPGYTCTTCATTAFRPPPVLPTVTATAGAASAASAAPRWAVRGLGAGMVISIAGREAQAESPPTASAFDLAAVSPPRRKLKAAAGAVAAASRLARKEDLRV